MKDTFVLDVDGEEVTCEVILGFTDDATGKEYIIYTDNSSDEDDQLNIYASQVILKMQIIFFLLKQKKNMHLYRKY